MSERPFSTRYTSDNLVLIPHQIVPGNGVGAGVEDEAVVDVVVKDEPVKLLSSKGLDGITAAPKNFFHHCG